jgi:hypothetical protein
VKEIMNYLKQNKIQNLRSEFYSQGQKEISGKLMGNLLVSFYRRPKNDGFCIMNKVGPIVIFVCKLRIFFSHPTIIPPANVVTSFL